MKSEYKSCLTQLDPENKKLLRKIKLYVDSRHLSHVAKEDASLGETFAEKARATYEKVKSAAAKGLEAAKEEYAK